MKEPFSKKQLDKAFPFDVEKPSARKIIQQQHHSSDCTWALIMVVLWSVLLHLPFMVVAC